MFLVSRVGAAETSERVSACFCVFPGRSAHPDKLSPLTDVSVAGEGSNVPVEGRPFRFRRQVTEEAELVCVQGELVPGDAFHPGRHVFAGGWNLPHVVDRATHRFDEFRSLPFERFKLDARCFFLFPSDMDVDDAGRHRVPVLVP